MNEASRNTRLPGVGDEILGKYKLTRTLGQGGMGVVFAATHIELRENVAIKVLLPEMVAQKEVVGRFMGEARAAAKIKSEHAARVIDVGKLDGDLPYMVMEYLEGEDLAHLIEKRRSLPLAEAIGYIRESATALAEAHRLGIVHRDIKPANLFLATRGDGSRILKVLDFGISKLTHDSLVTGGAVTRTNTVMGTPMYISPEQLRSTRDVDARADIWSLGVVFYELLTGAYPFEAESVPVLYAAILGAPYKPIRDRRPDLPQAIEDIMAKCLEKDRERRFGSLEEFVRALEGFTNLENSPISGSTPAAAARVGNWTRRAMVSTIMADAPTTPSVRSGKTMAIASLVVVAFVAGGFFFWKRSDDPMGAIPDTSVRDKPLPPIASAGQRPASGKTTAQADVQPVASTAAILETPSAAAITPTVEPPKVIATTSVAPTSPKISGPVTNSSTNNKVFDVGGRK